MQRLVPLQTGTKTPPGPGERRGPAAAFLLLAAGLGPAHPPQPQIPPAPKILVQADPKLALNLFIIREWLSRMC